MLSDLSKPAGIKTAKLLLTKTRTKKKLRFYLKWLIISSYVNSYFLASIFYSTMKPFDASAMLIWAKSNRLLLKLIGIKYRIINGHRMLPKGQSAIILPNHQSYLDNFGLLRLCDVYNEPINAMIRGRYFWVWPMGLALWLADMVFFDNSPGNEGGRRQFNESCSRIIAKKQKIYITPEGTRNRDARKLLPFRKGAFRIAIEHQIPIIPVVVSPYDFYDAGELRFDAGEITLDILEPIHTTGLTLDDVERLRDDVFDKMARKIEKPPNSKL